MTGRAQRLDAARVERAVAELLAAIGDDPARPGLLRTPQRVAQSAAELLGGIGADPVPALRSGRFAVADAAGTAREGDAAQPVLLRGVSFRSFCEHHLLPFTGTVHLAYVPDSDIVGLGRLYDLVETVTTRLTLQERIGDELVEALMAGLGARGALAVIEAVHGCVALRGSRQERGATVTVSARGTLAEAAARAELIALITTGEPTPPAVQ